MWESRFTSWTVAIVRRVQSPEEASSTNISSSTLDTMLWIHQSTFSSSQEILSIRKPTATQLEDYQQLSANMQQPTARSWMGNSSPLWTSNSTSFPTQGRLSSKHKIAIRFKQLQLQAQLTCIRQSTPYRITRISITTLVGHSLITLIIMARCRLSLGALLALWTTTKGELREVW